MKHPRWCLRFISPHEIHSVVQAVHKAESRTTADIIPMIVRRSSALGHLGLQISGVLSFLITGSYIVAERIADFDRLWILIVALLTVLPISELLARLPFVQRLMTFGHEREWQVHARATLEFYGSGFQHTKQHTGVLIFLSLMERKCVVLADEGIASKLPETTWKAVVDTIIAGIRSGRPAEGLINGIHMCGDILAAEFPAAAKHENQIPNELIIKE